MMKLFVVLLLAAVTVNGASAALRGITSVSFEHIMCTFIVHRHLLQYHIGLSTYSFTEPHYVPYVMQFEDYVAVTNSCENRANSKNCLDCVGRNGADNRDVMKIQLTA